MAFTPIFSRAYGKKLLELLTRKDTTATDAQPAQVWLAILETEPTGAQTGSTIKEAKWVGYKRVKAEGAFWKAVEEGAIMIISNEAEVEIPYTSGEGTVQWACLVDAETGGNVIVLGELSEKVTVDVSKSPLKFKAGELKFEIPSS